MLPPVHWTHFPDSKEYPIGQALQVPAVLQATSPTQVLLFKVYPATHPVHVVEEFVQVVHGALHF